MSGIVTSFPPELCDIIFSKVELDDLKNCRLVSSIWRDIFAPYVFANISIKWLEYKHNLKFLASIIAQTSIIGPLVRGVTINATFEYNQKSSLLEEQVPQALSLLPNLRFCKIVVDYHTDRKILDIILPSLSGLTEFDIKVNRFEHPLPLKYLHAVEKLTIRADLVTEISTITDSMQSLITRSRDLSYLDITYSPLLAGFFNIPTTSPQFPNVVGRPQNDLRLEHLGLTNVTVHPSGVHHLRALTSLRLAKVENSTEFWHMLLAEGIFIRCLCVDDSCMTSALLDYLEGYNTGRMIESLTVIDASTETEELAERFFMDTIRMHAPCLETLRVGVEHDNGWCLKEKYIPILASLPVLQTLQVQFGSPRGEDMARVSSKGITTRFLDSLIETTGQSFKVVSMSQALPHRSAKWESGYMNWKRSQYLPMEELLNSYTHGAAAGLLQLSVGETVFNLRTTGTQSAFIRLNTPKKKLCC